MPRTGRTENLIPNDQRTPEERRQNASKAGIASGETRRFKKTFREIAQQWYDKEGTVRKDGKTMTGQELVESTMDAVIAKRDKTSVAMLGILAGLDEKKVEVNANVQTTDLTEGMTNEELRKAIEAMENK